MVGQPFGIITCEKIYEVPKKIHGISEDSDKLPSPQDLNLEFDGFKPNRDFGTTEPEIVLKFSHERGENYQREMSGPLLSEKSCSRLSTYCVWNYFHPDNIPEN